MHAFADEDQAEKIYELHWDSDLAVRLMQQHLLKSWYSLDDLPPSAPHGKALIADIAQAIAEPELCETLAARIGVQLLQWAKLRTRAEAEELIADARRKDAEPAHSEAWRADAPAQGEIA